jgi:hypothetical protein
MVLPDCDGVLSRGADPLELLQIRLLDQIAPPRQEGCLRPSSHESANGGNNYRLGQTRNDIPQLSHVCGPGSANSK